MSILNESDHPASRASAAGANVFPASRAQMRFWYQEQFEPGGSARNVFARWRLHGETSTSVLTEAWKIIVGRHASLRTRFINDDGVPKQILEAAVPFMVREIDLTLLRAEAANDEADRIAAIEAQTPFDLARAPLLRVTHVRIDDRTSILMVSAHHIVADGWSFGILAEEMGLIVAALEGDRRLALPAPPEPYSAYVTREIERLASPAFASDREALRERMQGFQRFELVPDRPRPAVQTAKAEIASILLDRSLTTALEGIARQHACTLFMIAYAAFLLVLHERSGEDDITIGTQVTGRDDLDFERTIGTFINTVPLRTRISPDATFSALLEDVREGVGDTLELRGVPFDTLIDLVREKRDLSRAPLFGVNFIFQRSFIKDATYGSLRLVDLPSRTVGAMYDLCFFWVERPEGWRLSCEYNTDLFEHATIAGLLGRYEELLRALAAQPSISLRDMLRAKTSPSPAPTSEAVAHAIADLLGVDAIPSDEDIFALGFHSLLAMRLLARLKASYGIELPLRALFESPTVTGLADRIDRMRNIAPPLAHDTAIELLNPRGTREPFFYFHSDITSDGLYCRRLAALVGPDQPIYAIAPAGTAGIPAYTTVEDMAADALVRIRSVYPKPPLLLGGYCIGGLVAYEVARLLEAAGESARRVVLVNSTALPQRTIPFFDAMIRRIGANANIDRKVRARLCFNLAWIHAVLVSSPRRAAELLIERVARIRRRREPLWQMSEYPIERREQSERALASINAASFTYHLKPLGSDVALIWGEAQDSPANVPAAEWRSVARAVQVYPMPGNRFGPLNAEIEAFADRVHAALGSEPAR